MNHSLNIWVLVMCINLVACSQTKKKQKMNPIKMKIERYRNSILKSVEHYPNEPLFFISSGPGPDLYYEIKINDIIVKQRYFSKGEDPSVYRNFSSINHALNKNGKQKLSFKLFPSEANTFQSNSWVEIYLETRDQFEKDKTILNYEPPFKEDGETSEHIGLKSYSGSFEFEASLPYKKEIDWSNGVNLQEQEGIEEEVLAAFKEVMRLYAEGDLDTLLELYKPIFKAEAQSVYATKEKDYRLSYAVNWERFHPFFYKSKPTLNKDYELKFYANGRLATLEKKKKNITSYNESALSIVYDKNFDKFPDGVMRTNRHVLMFNQGTTPKMEMELYLLFYKPKGAKHLKLATDIFREEKLLNPVKIRY